ncbi:MAG: metallo-beta-lactamase superfamily protein [Phage 5P_2]|nr:MAG: metallo-beta-lactamase superfamily protein [Phage 5P_2]NPV30478.1 MBL fold metallo-hydrolase [Bacillota bacterium]
MKRSFFLSLLLAVLLVIIAGCGSQSVSVVNKTPAQSSVSEASPQAVPARQPNGISQPPVSGKLAVHFINVGQGDSILLQLPNNQTMLVDAGPNEAGPAVVSYLQKQGIKRIDYLVATHPHEDHIGGMDLVINSFDIGRVYMPRVTTNTKSFEDMLRAIQAKGLKITPARAGVVVLDKSGLKVNFVAPCSSGYDNLNNWSAATRVQFGNTSFLLTGDAQSESEHEMLASGASLKADVLKVGHHGSYSSTTPAFLRAVSPKYAVISVGAGNDYGHPHQETLAKLAGSGVKVYRTDRDGTVIFVSDGKTLTVKTLGGTIMPRAPNGATSAPVVPAASGGYIGNKNSKKFHRPDCQWAQKIASYNRVVFKSREEVVNAGYVPCKVCRP